MPAPGIDVKLRDSPLAPGTVDIQLDSTGDIAHEDSWDTAIYVSLFTDARATEDQMPIPERRRGWGGNERTPGQQMGGLLWLFEQPRMDRDLANALEDAADGALQWMVTEGYARSVKSTVTLINTERLNLAIRIVHVDGRVEEPLFELWENTGKTFLQEVA